METKLRAVKGSRACAPHGLLGIFNSEPYVMGEIVVPVVRTYRDIEEARKFAGLTKDELFGLISDAFATRLMNQFRSQQQKNR